MVVKKSFEMWMILLHSDNKVNKINKSYIELCTKLTRQTCFGFIAYFQVHMTQSYDLFSQLPGACVHMSYVCLHFNVVYFFSWETSRLRNNSKITPKINYNRFVCIWFIEHSIRPHVSISQCIPSTKLFFITDTL